MKHVLLWLIRFYQKVLSPLKRQPTCRFTPTCSAYAVEAIEKRGAFVGSLMTLDRILRCNPFCLGGYDPVPERGLRNPRYRAVPMTKYYYPEDYGLSATAEDASQNDTQ